MTVVIQRMVDADASGVLFTADPTTGKRSVAAVEAARGLGGAVVSGTVTADNVKYDHEEGAVLEYRSEGGDGNAVLTDEQLTTLVSYGEAIERSFGSPQDIKWSIVNGQLWILQMRPITTLFPVPAPAPGDDRVHVYYSWNHRQGMTEAMPPLVVDYWLRTINAMIDRLGYRTPDGSIGATAGGMVYFDLTPFVRSDRLAPRLSEVLEEFDRQAIEPLETVRRERYDDLAELSVLRGTKPRQTASTRGSLAPVVGHSVGSILQGLVTDRYARALQRGKQWADDSLKRLVLGEGD